MTAQTSTPDPMVVQLHRLYGLSREERLYLRQLGAKVGNLDFTSTTFTPPKGWRVVVRGNKSELYDNKQKLRLVQHHQVLKRVYLPGTDGGAPTPTEEFEVAPWASLLTRYIIEEHGDRYYIFDRQVGHNIGETSQNHKEAEGQLTRLLQSPFWRCSWLFWNDEIPKNWWQRLLFWRRDDKFATSPEELEQRLRFGENHGPDAMTVSGQTDTTAD